MQKNICQPLLSLAWLETSKTLKIYFDGSWLNIHYGEWNEQTYEEAYTPSKYKYITLTDVIINDIKTRGLYVQGDGTKVTSVTIE